MAFSICMKQKQINDKNYMRKAFGVQNWHAKQFDTVIANARRQVMDKLNPPRECVQQIQFYTNPKPKDVNEMLAI